MSEAWAPPRSSSERGIAGLVRTLFAAEQRGALAAGPRPSVSPSQSRSPPQHTWSVRKVRKPTFQKLSSAPDKSANAPLVGKFVLMLQRIGTHRTSDPYRKKTVEDNFYYKAREVRIRSEGATLKRALQTWDELWRSGGGQQAPVLGQAS